MPRKVEHANHSRTSHVALALVVGVAACSLSGCSSDSSANGSDHPGGAGALAGSNSVVNAAAGNSGAIAAGGSGPSSSGAGGAIGAGTAGAMGGGSASNPALDAACTAACQAQSELACAWQPCHDACVAEAAVTASVNTQCKTAFTGMLSCAATSSAAPWQCSSDENEPELAEGPCASEVCTWTCCVTDLYAPSDLWARCHQCE